MNTEQQEKAAAAFADRWSGRGDEKQDTQRFWIDLLQSVYGVENAALAINFEKRVRLSHPAFIDAYIPDTKVLIEQKSLKIDLHKAARQSDGSVLTPYEQAKRYADLLPYSERPRFIVTANFAQFLIYDEEHPDEAPQQILLADLPREYPRLSFLTNLKDIHLKKQVDVSVQAGRIVSALYEALSRQYVDPESEAALKSLNMLCVRLVFCLYAEDSHVFNAHHQFYNYLADKKPSQMRTALLSLFEVLNTPPEERSPYLEDELAAFPFVNGGLFADSGCEIPNFTQEIKDLLLTKASEQFDWSRISPTIFGAIFESTLNPLTRRSEGVHYTSIENIHKVIDPLFLNELNAEFNAIVEKIHLSDERRERLRSRNVKIGLYEKDKALLRAFQDKLASLKFLDPACGSGNFLTETFLSLRRLENRVLNELSSSHDLFIEDSVKVSINQFYGIELNDFAVSVAMTAMWIAQAQMLDESNALLTKRIDLLPLKAQVNIKEGNALTCDWTELFPQDIGFIMGNPPFSGAKYQSAEQRAEIFAASHQQRSAKILDYVCGWYFKAADYMLKRPLTKAAFVSTSSITQGIQPAVLWENLRRQQICINFACRSFKWDSDALNKANVYCVIIGFSAQDLQPKLIYCADGSVIKADKLNCNLEPCDDFMVKSRIMPLCPDAPVFRIGNKPIDNGWYLFTKEEMEEFIKQEPKAAGYFKPWVGGREFIRGQCRWCLWLGDASPAEISAMPHCRQRVAKVREFRLQSASKGTRLLADKPTRFHVETFPKHRYLVIPEVSTKNRNYLPIGFEEPEVLPSNLVKISEEAGLYEFGVLCSSLHMIWSRTLGGRLGDSDRYSIHFIYNNFVWPEASAEQRRRIEQTAQAVLDARQAAGGSSLLELYNPVLMPYALRQAHRANDAAVLELYGLPRDADEESVMQRLLDLYAKACREAADSLPGSALP